LLRFDPLSQRLWAIDCYDLEHFTSWFARFESGDIAESNTNTPTPTAPAASSELKHRHTPLPPPTFATVLRKFGPTFPSAYDPGLDMYPLKYRGVTFGFPLPSEYHHLYQPESKTMPLRLEILADYSRYY
jgi:hypothetical protein